MLGISPTLLRPRSAAWPVQAVVILSLLALVAFPRVSEAHGIWTHMHVNGWAIENLPEGELRDFFDHPEVKNAALFGAVFVDAGYGPSDDPPAREYSEHSHWEPFIQEFITWIIANDPPPWTNIESRKRVAFLMGCAGHGLQDEIFDSLFLEHLEYQEGGTQSDADPASDGFLALDGLLRFFPERYVPMATVLELMESVHPDIDEDTIISALDLVEGVYVNQELGPAIAAAIGEEAELNFPWMRAHYLDPAIPGSVYSEIVPTMGYFQAIWDRLHQSYSSDTPVTIAMPTLPQYLVGSSAASPEPWVAVIYGIGVAEDSPQVSWTDEAGSPVSIDVKGTRWGHEWPRLHQLRPKVDLVPGETYAITMAAGLELIDGTTSQQPLSWTARPCDGEPGSGGELGVDCPEPPEPTLSLTGTPEPENPEPENPESDDIGSDIAGSSTAEAAIAEPAIAEPAIAEPEIVSPGDDLATAPTDASDDGGCQAARQPGAPTWLVLFLLMGWGWRQTRRSGGSAY